tara:strand:- start:3798 stop:3962 length:165 start_codon:yes stop_codon:yes gene_type:complete
MFELRLYGGSSVFYYHDITAYKVQYFTNDLLVHLKILCHEDLGLTTKPKIFSRS